MHAKGKNKIDIKIEDGIRLGKAARPVMRRVDGTASCGGRRRGPGRTGLPSHLRASRTGALPVGNLGPSCASLLDGTLRHGIRCIGFNYIVIPEGDCLVSTRHPDLADRWPRVSVGSDHYKDWCLSTTHEAAMGLTAGIS
jgi:hypothetical protein